MDRARTRFDLLVIWRAFVACEDGRVLQIKWMTARYRGFSMIARAPFSARHHGNRL